MAKKEMPKACVILGAGASFDVIGERGVSVGRPPLAKDLFAPGMWAEILNRYPGAKFLSPKLENLKDTALEDALKELAEHPVMEVSSKFKEVPAYLRDLIYDRTSRHTNRPDAYVELVTKLLAGPPQHEVLFIVLNYDTLLEAALTQYSARRFSFRNLEDYTVDKQAKVVKLHGSVDWFRAFPRSEPNTKWHDELGLINVLERVAENDIEVIQGVPNVSAQREEDKGLLLYPVVTAPLTGKTLGEVVCPPSQQKTVQEFLQDCQKFLIAGTKGMDTDLSELLNSGIKPDNLLNKKHIVGGDTNETFNNLRYRVRGFDSPEVTRYENGFYDYVFGEGLDKFVGPY